MTQFFLIPFTVKTRSGTNNCYSVLLLNTVYCFFSNGLGFFILTSKSGLLPVFPPPNILSFPFTVLFSGILLLLIVNTL
jgi:hypothetical protein